MAGNLQTIGDFRRHLAGELKDIYPQGEAGAVISFLIESVTGLTHIEQLKNDNRLVTSSESELITRGSRELKTRRPVQHIAGYGWFMGRKFRVGAEVLIPRQETEELVLTAISMAGSDFSGTIIDFCTGSGCIAVTLALTLPQATVWATDLHKETLQTASHNINQYGAMVNLVRHNLLLNDFSSLPQASILVANPPYVRESEKALMEPGVLNFEPHTALFVPDDDPLLFYRSLLEAVRRLLVPGGRFCFEINEALGPDTLDLFDTSFISDCLIVNDINSKNRFITGTRASG
ncbi:MAG: peptide chain release factor N(5)-glutamine methyltransferase [Bacteroidales bacterium]|nr:peptide chain release factor N(5)-glutamine methyltransferase [Bacteroidales bacterium]